MKETKKSSNVIIKLGGLEQNTNQRKIVYDKTKISPTLQAAMGSGGGVISH